MCIFLWWRYNHHGIGFDIGGRGNIVNDSVSKKDKYGIEPDLALSIIFIFQSFFLTPAAFMIIVDFL